MSSYPDPDRSRAALRAGTTTSRRLTERAIATRRHPVLGSTAPLTSWHWPPRTPRRRAGRRVDRAAAGIPSRQDILAMPKADHRQSTSWTGLAPAGTPRWWPGSSGRRGDHGKTPPWSSPSHRRQQGFPVPRNPWTRDLARRSSSGTGAGGRPVYAGSAPTRGSIRIPRRSAASPADATFGRYPSRAACTRIQPGPHWSDGAARGLRRRACGARRPHDSDPDCVTRYRARCPRPGRLRVGVVRDGLPPDSDRGSTRSTMARAGRRRRQPHPVTLPYGRNADGTCSRSL